MGSPNSQRAIAAAAACALAWGLVTFGAVYPWAYVPMFLFCAASGLVTLCWRNGGYRPSELALMGLVPAAIAIQLLPLPLVPNSGAAGVLRYLSVQFAIAGDSWHSISVAPQLTAVALVAVTSLTLWTVGAARMLTDRVHPATLARITTVIGAAIALEAVAQKALFNGKIYWFWESPFKGWHNYFGPFVNRNHFAGWMLLALPLTAAYLCAQVTSTGRSADGDWRRRILWLSSAESSHVVLTSAAGLVMAVALVWSMSRSGIAGGTTACLILAGAAAYRMRSVRAAFASGAIVLILCAAAAWKGADQLATWYGKTNTLEWRFHLWQDTLPALEDFWVTGAGLNTYGKVMLVYPQTDTTVHAQQAHNDYLQLAVEGGALVCIPVLVLVVALGRVMVKRLKEPQDETTWWIRLGAVSGICGMALQSITEFSLQIPGVALLFATCVAIAIHEPAPVLARPQRSRRVERRELVTSI
jgi:O-antigen ligase